MQRKTFLPIVLGLVALASCKMPTIESTLQDESKVTVDSISRSIIGGDEYVGDGYNVIDGSVKTFPFQSLVARRTVGDQSVSSSNDSVESIYELETFLKYGVSITGNLTAFDIFNGESSFTYNTSSKVKIDSSTVTLIGICDYQDSTVFIDSSTPKSEAQSLYETNLSAFESTYGNGYVDRVLIGERLIIVYQFSDIKESKITHTDAKAVAKVKFLQLFDGTVTGDLGNIDVTEVLNNVTISCKIFCTGGYIPPAVYDRDTYSAAYNGWTSYINSKVASGQSLSVIKRLYKSYDSLFGQTQLSNVDDYYVMYKEWEKLKSKVTKIYNDSTDTVLTTECTQLLNQIQIELNRCLARTVDSRMPSATEIDEIEKKWLLNMSSPVAVFSGKTEIRVMTSTPSGYGVNIHYMPWKHFSNPILYSDSSYLRLDSNDLEENKSLTELNRIKPLGIIPYKINPANAWSVESRQNWEYTGKPIRVFKQQVDNTIPVYCLEKIGPLGTGFQVLTTSTDEKTTLILSKGYHASPSGIILGYIYPPNYVDLLNIGLTSIQRASASLNIRAGNIGTLALSFGSAFANLPITNIDTKVWNSWYHPTTINCSFYYDNSSVPVVSSVGESIGYAIIN